MIQEAEFIGGPRDGQKVPLQELPCTYQVLSTYGEQDTLLEPPPKEVKRPVRRVHTYQLGAEVGSRRSVYTYIGIRLE
jgi:hypothetical protein